MSTSTATLTASNPTSRLTSSNSSLSASQSSQSPSIARIYKQASQLFVTRRILEALETLEPLIRRPEHGQHGEWNGETSMSTNGSLVDQQLAPIATASRGARVKVWSLYISILNEIVELGAEVGKKTFGAARWKQYLASARDGEVWAEIVDVGYSSVEGLVDAEVVANLATLLLAHAPTQKLTQQRLETYLSASSTPLLDVSEHLEGRRNARVPQSNGTSTPRDLVSRLKILEIYTLHVLPRNSEWEYAREFIAMSEFLDDDRREAFSQALQNIQDERTFDSKREEELKRQREQQLEDARRRDEDARKAQEAKIAAEKGRKRPQPSETNVLTEDDFGVDSTRIGSQKNPSRRPADSKAASGRSVNTPRNQPSKQSRPAASPRNPRGSPPTVFRRVGFIVHSLQHGVVSMGQSVRNHPMLLFRILAFIVALLMALSRRDIRDRLRRARVASWEKLKTTVGMGMKVSYI